METDLRLDRRLHNFTMPPIEPIDRLELGDEDLFIAAAGFENRCVASLEMAIRNDVSARANFIIFEYLPYIEENKIDLIKSLILKTNTRLLLHTYNRETPKGIFHQFSKIVNQFNGRIFIDISGMSRLLIVQLVYLIAKCDRHFSKTSILYTMAEKYPPSIDEVDEAINKLQREPIALLSSGVYELCIIPELSSIYMSGQPIRLIVFPSFNTQQLSALRTEIQTSYFSIINGIPFLESNSWRTDKIRILNNIEEMHQKQEYNVSTFYYPETLKTLLKIYDEHSVTDRLLIAPTGSKMQAIAVGIFRSFLKDIQIVYPTPRNFPNPTKYTTGIVQTYRIDLDPLSDFI